MKNETIILLQDDARISQNLISSLSKAFHGIYIAHSMDDVINNALKHKAKIAIIDMEAASISDLQTLTHTLPHLRIVCNHRLADDELWMTALNAGASDCCLSSDTNAILSAALRGSGPISIAAA
jgi:DNA-binding NarL/FixJ family response regulator